MWIYLSGVKSPSESEKKKRKFWKGPIFNNQSMSIPEHLIQLDKYVFVQGLDDFSSWWFLLRFQLQLVMWIYLSGVKSPSESEKKKRKFESTKEYYKGYDKDKRAHFNTLTTYYNLSNNN
jgi:hypothetical protein